MYNIILLYYYYLFYIIQTIHYSIQISKTNLFETIILSQSSESKNLFSFCTNRKKDYYSVCLFVVFIFDSGKTKIHTLYCTIELKTIHELVGLAT